MLKKGKEILHDYLSMVGVSTVVTGQVKLNILVDNIKLLLLIYPDLGSLHQSEMSGQLKSMVKILLMY